jgi:hypothetical protein
MRTQTRISKGTARGPWSDVTMAHPVLCYLMLQLFRLAGAPLIMGRWSLMEKFQQGVQMRAMAEYIKDDEKRDCALFIWGCIMKTIDPDLGDEIIGNETGFSESSFFEDLGSQVESAGEPSGSRREESDGCGRMEAEGPEESGDEPNEFIDFDYLRQQREEHSIKYLYQCLLAFRSSEPERVKTALQDLPYIVLKHLHQTEAVEEALIESLFLLHDNGSIPQFDSLKLRCLVVLVLVVPQKFANKFAARFFLADVSLGERMHLLTVLDSCLWEILGKANRQSLIAEVLDSIEGEARDRESWGNMRVVVLDEAQSRGQEISRQRKDKLECQSRRWGYAKRATKPLGVFSILQTGFVDRVVETLKPIYYVFFLHTLQFASTNVELFRANPILLTLFYKVLITFCQVSSSLP